MGCLCVAVTCRTSLYRSTLDCLGWGFLASRLLPSGRPAKCGSMVIVHVSAAVFAEVFEVRGLGSVGADLGDAQAPQCSFVLDNDHKAPLPFAKY